MEEIRTLLCFTKVTNGSQLLNGIRDVPNDICIHDGGCCLQVFHRLILITIKGDSADGVMSVTTISLVLTLFLGTFIK